MAARSCAGKAHLKRAILGQEEALRLHAVCRALRRVDLLQVVLAQALQRSLAKYSELDLEDDFFEATEAPDIRREWPGPWGGAGVAANYLPVPTELELQPSKEQGSWEKPAPAAARSLAPSTPPPPHTWFLPPQAGRRRNTQASPGAPDWQGRSRAPRVHKGSKVHGPRWGHPLCSGRGAPTTSQGSGAVSLGLSPALRPQPRRSRGRRAEPPASPR